MNTELETKDFPTAAILSISTGRLLSPFEMMHEAIEWVMGHPVWTHELGSEAMANRLKEAVLSQHPQLSEIDVDLTKDNFKEWLKLQVAVFGDTLPLIRGSEVRTENPLESRQRLADDKPVIVNGTS